MFCLRTAFDLTDVGDSRSSCICVFCLVPVNGAALQDLCDSLELWRRQAGLQSCCGWLSGLSSGPQLHTRLPSTPGAQTFNFT